MKKRKVVGKKGSKRKSHDKTWIAVGIIAFLVLGFALSFVNVPQNSTVTGYATEGFIDQLFTNWSSGNLDVNIAKYFFWIIVCLFIFSALNYVKIPEQTFLQWALAILVSFLATAYIAPNEVFAILTTYTALGLTFSIIVPFAIMIFFSAMLLSNKKLKDITPGKIIMEVILWYFFTAFLIYKLIAGYTDVDRSNGILMVIWGLFVVAVIILVWNEPFRKWVRNVGHEVAQAKAEVKEVAADIAEA